MKNGHYEYIIDTGLAKNITDFYFKSMSQFKHEFKNGGSIEDPLTTIIKGDSKLDVPVQQGMEKKDHVALIRIGCDFLDAEAVVMFFEASQWTGTPEERDWVKKHMGDIHGHAKAKDVLISVIETQGKYIVGHADVTHNGKERNIGQMEWSVMDLPDADYVTFSNFLPTKETI